MILLSERPSPAVVHLMLVLKDLIYLESSLSVGKHEGQRTGAVAVPVHKERAVVTSDLEVDHVVKVVVPLLCLRGLELYTDIVDLLHSEHFNGLVQLVVLLGKQTVVPLRITADDAGEILTEELGITAVVRIVLILTFIISEPEF